MYPPRYTLLEATAASMFGVRLEYDDDAFRSIDITAELESWLMALNS